MAIHASSYRRKRRPSGQSKYCVLQPTLFACSVLMRFPQADSRPSAVLINEFDAGIFQSVANSPDHLRFLGLCGFRNRTPSPPPLSLMKTIPAASNALRIAASFARVIVTSPSTTSALRMVATPTLEARARSRAVHRISARAARICALEIFSSGDIDFLHLMI